MQLGNIYLCIIFMLLAVNSKAQQNTRSPHFSWSQLTALPDKHGFAGSFAGVSNGCLIVAGGANFPDGGAPWTGSKKAWTDKIFVLEKPDGAWKEAGRLSQPLGYGVSIVYNNQLICFGGSNEKGHSKDVFSITYQHGEINIRKLPDLPTTLANSAGALVGNTVYIAGGLISPDDKHAARNFWSIDLAQPADKQTWQILETWPGPERMLSVAGVQNGSFYIFSGAALTDDGKGSVKRIYLMDAYKYKKGEGWKKLHNMPYATVAAAGPAYSLKHREKDLFLIFGGDDGKMVEAAGELQDKHPGFTTNILGYDVAKNSWFGAGKIFTDKKSDSVLNPNNSTWAPVTTTSVLWNGSLIFSGGEVRPAVRTPRVLRATYIPVLNKE